MTIALRRSFSPDVARLVFVGLALSICLRLCEGLADVHRPARNVTREVQPEFDGLSGRDHDAATQGDFRTAPFGTYGCRAPKISRRPAHNFAGRGR